MLFLSFANATVSRVSEVASEYLGSYEGDQGPIEITTYHSFFLKIVKTHGYLLGLPRKLSVLNPVDESIALCSIRIKYKPEKKMTNAEKKDKEEKESEERKRLAEEEGRICFDLFSDYAIQILKKSKKIRDLFFLVYPFIIVDEFQDTTEKQWEIVKYLGKRSTIMVLADPDQSIY